MHQLEIKFFWPLTEQIPLDLDFKPSEDYLNGKSYMLNIDAEGCVIGNRTYTFSLANSNITPSLTLDLTQTPITIMSEKKPNFIKRVFYKILDINWKVK